MMRTLIATVLAAGLVLGAASAQDLDNQVTIVEELIARPIQPGPAWWKVSDADSAVYILPELEWAPTDLRWTKSVLERRIEGANLVILPTDVSVNPLAIAKILSIQGSLRERGKAVDRLSPEGRRAFAYVMSQIGKYDDAYDNWAPRAAANLVETDYLQAVGFEQGHVTKAARKLARTHRVRTELAAHIPVTKMQLRPAEMVGDHCLDQAVRTVENRSVALDLVSLAWAKGDVRPVVFPPPRARFPAGCDEDIGTNFAELKRAVSADEAGSVEKALRKPGRTVAVLEAESLLKKDGVLELLRARGYQVTTPDLIQD